MDHENRQAPLGGVSWDGQRDSDPDRGDRKEKLIRSFGYAFHGIGVTVRHERNMKIHCCAAVLVVLAGLVLGLSRQEWFTCLILFALVMSLECVNTAVEAVVDLVMGNKRHPLAAKAKDAAAGAVLIAAIFSAVIGLWIFVPKLLALFA